MFYLIEFVKTFRRRFFYLLILMFVSPLVWNAWFTYPLFCLGGIGTGTGAGISIFTSSTAASFFLADEGEEDDDEAGEESVGLCCF